MLELSREKMATAIEKARRTRCYVRMLAWRRYSVTTPAGHVYTVTFDVQDGRRLGSCTCAARKECFHLAAAVHAHCLIAAMKAEHEPICEERVRPALAGVMVKPQPASLGRVGGFEI